MGMGALHVVYNNPRSIFGYLWQGLVFMFRLNVYWLPSVTAAIIFRWIRVIAWSLAVGAISERHKEKYVIICRPVINCRYGYFWNRIRVEMNNICLLMTDKLTTNQRWSADVWKTNITVMPTGSYCTLIWLVVKPFCLLTDYIFISK